MIRSQNVYDHEFRTDGLVYVDDEVAKKLERVAVQPGDVLLNITGESIARCCVAPAALLPARVNQHVAIIRPNPNQLDGVFLQKYLSHPRVKAYMLGHDSGGSRKALTKGHIERFVVPLPPLSEQQAIASILCAFDDKIDLNRCMNDMLEEMARVFFKSWFVDFDPVRAKLEGRQPAGMDDETAALFPDSFEDSMLGDIPKGWRMGVMEDLMVLQRGFDLPKKERALGPYPVLAASGPTGTHDEYKVEGPSVTTGRSGVLGKVFFVHENYWPLNTSLWVKKFNASRPLHAYHLLSTLNLGALNAGSAVPTLNRNHIHNLLTLIPDTRVIEAFEELAMPMFSDHRANSRQSETLAAIRDALLPKLLSGEVRVREAQEIVEDAV